MLPSTLICICLYVIYINYFYIIVCKFYKEPICIKNKTIVLCRIVSISIDVLEVKSISLFHYNISLTIKPYNLKLL